MKFELITGLLTGFLSGIFVTVFLFIVRLGMSGYSGSFCASDFGATMPVISVQNVPVYNH